MDLIWMIFAVLGMAEMNVHLREEVLKRE